VCAISSARILVSNIEFCVHRGQVVLPREATRAAPGRALQDRMPPINSTSPVMRFYE